MGVHGRREVHPRQADGALLRPARGSRADRRARPARGHGALPARPARHRPPGGPPLHRHHRREPGVRASRRHRRRDPGGGRRRRRHRLHRGAARRLRHADHRARLGAVGGPAPADLVRAGPGGRPAPADPGRGHLVGGPPRRGTSSTRPSTRSSPGARRSSSPTASPRSATPTASWCSRAGGSWSRAPTSSCWISTAATPPSTTTGPRPRGPPSSRLSAGGRLVRSPEPVRWGDRLAVGRRVLAPVAGVRILLPQLSPHPRRVNRWAVAHSSRGLGRRPLTAVTRVQIPYALLCWKALLRRGFPRSWAHDRIEPADRSRRPCRGCVRVRRGLRPWSSPRVTGRGPRGACTPPPG